MPIHNLAFWFCAFFLLGVFFISILNNFLIIFVLSLLISGYFIFSKNYIFALLGSVIILGVGYYQIFDYFQKTAAIPFDQKSEVTGMVKKVERSFSSQKLAVSLQPPYNGKIQVNAQPFPEFNYGDLIGLKGIIKEPPAESAQYYAKENIFGLMSFAKIELIKTGQGNYIMAKLLQFKNQVKEVFKNSLPQEKAQFLAGLTLGDRESFSKEFQDKMKLSGTTHLVALSGYNISVIVWVAGLLLGSLFSRSASFYLSILIIVLFVLMTGMEASVVRAAIMGVIALIAKQTERLYSIRNAIVVAAFLMILANPKILVFDLGFQLSFLALLGLVYLMPALKQILKIKNPGFLSWKENALTTVSAQLAVVPLLLSQFGLFSLTSFFANILILWAIPFTMGIGFMVGALGLFSGFLAKIAALAVNLFLSYELWVIDIFSKFSLKIITQSFGFGAALIYYSILLGVILYVKNNTRFNNRA